MDNLLTLRWMFVKAALFVVIAALAAGVLMAREPTFTTVGCVAAIAWASSRAYYFAFYVIEHYVDPGYRFAWLWSFAVWLWRERRRQ